MNNNNFEKEIFEVYVDDILPNRFQPRLSFDQNALNELANSIRQHGIIQPLVVRKLGDKYEIIAGERRYKAAVLVGLKKVPVIVMDIDDNKSAEIAIVENIQRKEMTALEEAKAFKKLLDKGYLTQDQLAIRMGKSQPLIANKLRLLNLDEEVQEALLNGQISERHARSLLSIKTPEEQKKVLSEIINNKLTVKQTDEIIKERYGNVIIANKEEPVIATPVENKPVISEENINPQMAMLRDLNIKTDSNNTTLDESVYIDFNKLKNEAEDIHAPKTAPADLGILLKDDRVKKDEENKSRFWNEIEEPKIPEEIEIFDIEENKNDLRGAASKIRENVESLKKNGYKISSEEFDFENLYQIIIKIQK